MAKSLRVPLLTGGEAHKRALRELQKDEEKPTGDSEQESCIKELQSVGFSKEQAEAMWKRFHKPTVQPITYGEPQIKADHENS